MAILENNAQAEDAVSESFEKLMVNIDKLDDVLCHRTKAYIVTTVRNTSINILKKQRRTDNIADEELDIIVDTNPSVLDEVVSQEGIDTIKKILKSLPPSQKDTAYLWLFHEYSNCEIAEELGISQDTVRQRLSRARKAIKRNIWGGDGHDK
jgi:RNA polymerase sigma-70 factor (ECF subfamily)